jgi:hypothetical protein
VLCVRGERFELGAALSPAAETHVAAAFDLLKTLCRNLNPVHWAALAQGAATSMPSTGNTGVAQGEQAPPMKSGMRR